MERPEPPTPEQMPTRAAGPQFGQVSIDQFKALAGDLAMWQSFATNLREYADSLEAKIRAYEAASIKKENEDVPTGASTPTPVSAGRKKRT